MSDDLRMAKAEAKAAKAKAKSLRPWYKKKRWWLAAVVVVIVIAAIAGSSGSKSPSSSNAQGNSSAGAGTTVSTNSANPGCLANPGSYLGSQSGDCVANPTTERLSMANTNVTAKWSVTNGNLGDPSVCAAISIRNLNNDSITYNDLYWSLQLPSGKSIDPNFEANNDLGSGNIAAGGVATGNVCFDYSGVKGQYVGIYQPDEFNNQRGIWVVNVN